MEAISLEFDMCPYCGGEIEVDGENSWHCVEYEFHRGTFDNPEDVLMDEITTENTALRAEVERLKTELDRLTESLRISEMGREMALAAAEELNKDLIAANTLLSQAILERVSPHIVQRIGEERDRHKSEIERLKTLLKDILRKLYAAGARQHCGIMMVCEEIEEALK